MLATDSISETSAPLRPENPTSTFFAVKGPNGDLTWRVESPAHAIGAKVQYIPDDEGFEALYWPNTGDAFPWRIELGLADGRRRTVSSKKAWRKLAREEDAIHARRAVYPAMEGTACVWTRPLAWQAAHMMEMRREYGVRVLAECDDNYLSDKRLNIFMQKAGWGENDRDNHTRSICVGDGLIVSTEYLRDTYWKGLTNLFGKKDVPEIFVCRNHVDERFVPTELSPRREDGRLRIGYMGSDSHIWDVDLIYEALRAAYDLGHEIVFVGINPTLLNPKFRRASKKDWSRIEYTHIPWRNDGYRGSALPLDIGFCPLIVDNHTLGKSDIKWMEYALSGAATIAQNCLVYNRTAVHGEHALMANSPKEFHDRMIDLIERAPLRERLVANTRQYIREERLLLKNANEWRSAVLG